MSFLCLSIAVCANSLTLLATRSAKLSFLLTFITFFIFSQLISDSEHLDLAHFAYAHYYLLSVYLAQDVQTVSRSWQNVRQSRALC